MKTTGNTIFISGGSAGIGLAIAKKLIAEGNKVIINGRNEERLQSALNELGSAISVQGDLSSEEGRFRISGILKEQYPDINIIINNAGAVFVYDLKTTEDVYQKAVIEMNTNYFSVVHFTELMLPHLLQKSEAAVINISSISAFGSRKGLPTYAATKAALHSYTGALRSAYAEDKNIQIYEVYPPLTNTEFSASIGGINGIPASEVADELLIAMENDLFDVLVGASKKYFEMP